MTRIKLAVVVVAAVVIQSSIFTTLRFDGVAPELPYLLAGLAGYLAGPDRGAVFGFAIGLLYDVMLQSPLGLAALSAALVAWAIGTLSSGLMHRSWWTATVFAAGATAVGVAAFALIGEVFGQRGLVSADLLRIMGIASLLSLLLAPLSVVIMRWCYVEDPRTGARTMARAR